MLISNPIFIPVHHSLCALQLSMLSGLFPRHVIEYFSTHAEAVPEHMGRLARNHEGVTILFMDIVGESLYPN